MPDKKKFYLVSYGKSLTEFARMVNHQIKIQKETGETLLLEKDIYLCPMCMKNFFYFLDGEYFESETFSDDHYPPESVGGNQIMYVCKPCNDFYGRKMDYVLKEYLQSQAFLNKHENAVYPLKFSYSGIPGSYKVNTEWQDGKMVKNVNFKKYPYVKDWMLDIKKGEWSFNIKISFPTEQLIAMALLRAAYLYCFANWGYDFAFSTTGKNFRDVLQGKEIHPLSNLGVYGDESSKSLTNGFYFVSHPKKYQAFLVIFDISLQETDVPQKVFVIIPGPSEQAWSDLTKFKSWINKKEANTKVIKLYDDCIKRELYTHYHFTWEKLRSN